MNALRLAALLSVSAASFAGGRLAQPALYEPLTSASLPRVTVLPAGACHDGATPGPYGGCWETEAPWTVASVSGHLPALSGTHRSATNAATIAQVRGLLETVGLAAARAALAGPLSVPGVYPALTLAHVEWASFVLRQDGARLAQPAAFPAVEVRVRVPALVAGVPPLERVVQVPAPYQVVTGVDADGGTLFAPAPGTLPPEAVAAVGALIDGYVLPAITAETGLQ